MTHNVAIRAVATAGERKGRSFNKITANWVMIQFAVILLNDLPLASSMTTADHTHVDRHRYDIVASRNVAFDA